jgi:hypothetical protein
MLGKLKDEDSLERNQESIVDDELDQAVTSESIG